VKASLDVFLPLPLTMRGPSYTCGMLAQGMAGPDLDVTIVTPRVRSSSVHPAQVVQTLPYWARHLPYRWIKSLAMEEIDAAFLAHVGNAKQQNARAAYIWPDAALKTILDLKRLNIRQVRKPCSG
jgi:hypothetical protein